MYLYKLGQQLFVFFMKDLKTMLLSMTMCNTELFHNPYWIVITQFDDNEDGYCVTDEGEPVGYLEMLSSGLVYSFGSIAWISSDYFESVTPSVTSESTGR